MATHEDKESWEYDINGIPYYNYGDKIGIQRNPLFVAEEVIHHSADYNRTGNQSSREVILNNANWLVANAVSHDDYSTLEYKFPLPKYAMEPPWRSGMAQGRAIEALVRAHEITNNQTYLDTAKSLLNSFFIELEDGGVTLKTGAPLDSSPLTQQNGWWYEEYADDNLGHNSSGVLNGMIWALLSIHEYYKYTNDSSAKFLFDQGLLALRNSLPHYDNNGYSYYDIYENPAELKYHLMHINLLQMLLDIVDVRVLQQYYGVWHNYILSSDITPPRVTGTNTSGILPISNLSSIVVRFNEPMDHSSLNNSIFVSRSHDNVMCNNENRIYGIVNLTSDGKTAILRPTSELAPNAKYVIAVSKEIRDLNGNGMLSDKAWSFTIGAEGHAKK